MHRFTAVVSLCLVLAAPALPGAPTEPAVAPLLDLGSAFSVGLGVSPLRSQLPAPLPAAPESEGGRPADPDGQATALSFDLMLRWPGTEASRLEPYLAFGPALFVVEPDYAGRLLGTRTDPSFRVGARAGAGVNWKVGRDITLFGAYGVTTAADSALPATGATSATEAGLSGHDFTYGLRLRF